jgi:hypothetical protein
MEMNLENSRGKENKDESGLTSPPLVPLVLRVGVTGHRPDPTKRPTPDIAQLRRVISEVLKIILDSANGVADVSDGVFARVKGEEAQRVDRRLRIISALAAGADQWLADEAIKLGYELQSPLPFAREEYRKDFKNSSDAKEFDRLLGRATAVLELDGKVDHTGRKRSPDPRSYEAVGRAILNQSDILIAIWDGKAGAGPGGTANVVMEGHRRGIPVVWIPWEDPKSGKLGLPNWRLVKYDGELKDDKSRLKEVVHKLLQPPPDLEGPSTTRVGYFGEVQKKGRPLLGVWMFFRALLCGEFIGKRALETWRDFFSLKWFRVNGFMDSARKTAKNDWSFRHQKTKVPMEHPVPVKLREWIDEFFLPHYAWANGLSLYYGTLYRSAFLVNSILGALAVFLALVCIGLGVEGRLQTGWIIAEFVVIMGILALTHRGRVQKWHVRWLDYRMLAERLRVARCAGLMGGGGPQTNFAAHHSSYGDPLKTWMHWHYRAIERAAGLSDVSLTKEYLESCKEFWCESLLEDQHAYHKSNESRSEKIDHRLHRAGDFMFGATLIACAVHVLHLWVEGDPRFDWIPEQLSGWMTVVCACLPALGAAFATIRSQAETQRLKQRSQAMAESLATINRDLSSIGVSEESLSSIELRDQFDRATDLMIREMLDWRVVFQDRPLGLPV